VASGLDAEQLAAIEQRHKELVAARTNRNTNPEGLASSAEVSGMRLEASMPLHSTTQPGILTVALSPADGGEPEVVATGAKPRGKACFQAACETWGLLRSSKLGSFVSPATGCLSSAGTLMSGHNVIFFISGLEIECSVHFFPLGRLVLVPLLFWR
jgi:hypothetical protein